MKALILAAGKGERLRPLTLKTPKALVEINGRTLLDRHICKLIDAGFKDIVINISWLREKIKAFIQQKNYQGINIQFSDEGDRPLETGGGMLRALPLLGKEPFLVINADIYTTFNFSQITRLDDKNLIQLILVNNPKHNPKGDFCLNSSKLTLKSESVPNYTYSGIGIYHPELFKNNTKHTAFSVVPLINQAIKDKQASAQLYQGSWSDVGTQKRLDELNQQ